MIRFKQRGQSVARPLPKSWTETVAIPELEIETIAAPTLDPAKVLLDHYTGLRAGGAMPTRAQIDPLDIPRAVLPSVYLLEPTDGYSDWIYRLIGTEIVERFGVDRTGQSLKSFLPPHRAALLIENSNRVVAAGKPMCFRLRPHRTAMQHFYAETMSLPIEDTRSGNTWLFGGTFFGGATLD